MLNVGCYGKLPFWPEFLELDATAPVAQAFKDWLHRGLAEARLQLGEAEGDVQFSGGWRLLFAPPGGTELLAGVIRPSADEGYRRSFPFSVFSVFPRRDWSGGDFSLLPLALARTFAALEILWDECANTQSPSGLQAILHSSAAPSPPPPNILRPQFQAELTKDSERLFTGRLEDHPEALARNLPLAVSWIKNKSGDGRLTIEAPVSAGLEDACFDASFWVELLNRQFLMRRLSPSIFLPTYPQGPRPDALFFIGPIQPVDCLLFLEGATPAAPLSLTDRGSGTGPADPIHWPTFADLLHARYRV